MTVNLRVCLYVCMLLGAGPACSDLVVLGSDSGASPASDRIPELLDRFQFRNSPDDNQSFAVNNHAERPPHLTPSAKTNGIYRVNVKLPNPVCVIGFDQLSRKWLIRNRLRLAGLGASCLLVETHNRQQLKTVRKLAHPVPVHAIPFAGLARQIGLRNIPVLLVGS